MASLVPSPLGHPGGWGSSSLPLGTGHCRLRAPLFLHLSPPPAPVPQLSLHSLLFGDSGFDPLSSSHAHALSQQVQYPHPLGPVLAPVTLLAAISLRLLLFWGWGGDCWATGMC